MRKLGDLKQVVCQPAHHRAGAVAVKVIERQRLHMVEKILTHLRLDENAHAVADHGDKVVAQTL